MWGGKALFCAFLYLLASWSEMNENRKNIKGFKKEMHTTQPLQKLGIFYYYFNPILQTIFFLFFMLEPATLYLFFPILNLLLWNKQQNIIVMKNNLVKKRQIREQDKK